jgi:peptidoglycan-N-acetylglucosamine deacetylase
MYNPFSWGHWRPVIHRQPSGFTDVALTFDDGPHPETTPAILDMLRQHNCKATFFFTGVRVAAHGDLVARTVEAGHAVYGHGWEHEHFEHAPGTQILASMQRVEAALREFRPTPGPYLVRLPYNAGSRSSRIHALMEHFHADARFVSWTITTDDWMLAGGCADLSDLARRCTAAAHEIGELQSLPGAVVLMHEAPFGASGALSPLVARMLLPEVLKALARRGLATGLIEIDRPRRARDRFFCWHPRDNHPIKSLRPEAN